MNAEKSFENLVQKTLPHSVRETFQRTLEENQGPPLRRAVESILWIPASYWTQARLAFRRWVFAVVFLLVVFCFAFSSMPRAYAAELIAVLGALTLRDGYMHNRKLKDGVSSNAQFSEQSIGDAAIAGLFAFVAWAVLRGVSPSSAMPFPNLWRGAVTLMGTLFTLKMMVRVEQNPNAPLFNKDDDHKKIYSRVRWLSFLWFITLDGVVACNVTDIPHYWPDKLRGWAPMFFFITWWAFQKEQIGWFTRFGRLSALVVRLTKRFRRKDGVCWGHLATEAGMMLLIALSILDAVLPWMTGSIPAAASAVQAAGAILSGGISLISWKYVKEANLVAASWGISHKKHKRHIREPSLCAFCAFCG